MSKVTDLLELLQRRDNLDARITKVRQEIRDEEMDAKVKVNGCPFDFAHTKHWCGYENCRQA